jgi:DNA-binding transcriptional regulator YhcF (GntR family)
MRTIERLLQQEIIYSKRGKGNFLTDKAYDIILDVRVRRLMEQKLPALAEELQLLHFSPTDVKKRLEELMVEKK